MLATLLLTKSASERCQCRLTRLMLGSFCCFLQVFFGSLNLCCINYATEKGEIICGGPKRVSLSKITRIPRMLCTSVTVNEYCRLKFFVLIYFPISSLFPSVNVRVLKDSQKLGFNSCNE